MKVQRFPLDQHKNLHIVREESHDEGVEYVVYQEIGGKFTNGKAWHNLKDAEGYFRRERERMQNRYAETEKDIVYMAGWAMGKGFIETIGDSREFLNVTVPSWAKEFEEMHIATVWDDHREDYMDCVEKFAEQKLKEHFDEEVL